MLEYNFQHLPRSVVLGKLRPSRETWVATLESQSNSNTPLVAHEQYSIDRARTRTQESPLEFYTNP